MAAKPSLRNTDGGRFERYRKYSGSFSGQRKYGIPSRINAKPRAHSNRFQSNVIE